MLEVIEIAIPVRLGDVHAPQRFVAEREVLLEPGAEVDALRVEVAFGFVASARRGEVALERLRRRAEVDQAFFEVLRHRRRHAEHVEDADQVERVEPDLAGFDAAPERR